MLFRDGEGTWTKLTGTKGVYTFEMEDPQGRYSVVAFNKPSCATEVVFLHATVSEAKGVSLEFGGREDDSAVPTIFVPRA